MKNTKGWCEMLFPNENLNDDMITILNTLIERFEYELVEFKEADKNYKQDEIGRYFSAISNEANLKGQQYGWLVFGVRNKDKKIVGTDYRDAKGLDTLKQEISANTNNSISFIDIFEVYPQVDGETKRVVMFKIPAAVAAIPTAWKGHFYGRAGESLGPLSTDESDRIRSQKRADWSRTIIENGSIEQLDKKAITVARNNYKEKNKHKEHIVDEVSAMSDFDFLTKLKLIVDGKLTNACMLLLGKKEFDSCFGAPPQIMWRLYSEKGDDKDYEIFTIPFILAVDEVYKKIRNLTYRYMPMQLSLFPIETQQYDSWLIRELLNNCIVHQDYTIGSRIYVDEFEDNRLKVTNFGKFLPERIEPVLEPSYSPPYYRNSLLADAMREFNMIDTATFGIRRIFKIQKEKYFPLPEYILDDSNKVSVLIYGKVLNENYVRLLYGNSDLSLHEVFLLDRVQKNIMISKDDAVRLKKQGFVEGRYPNIFVSAVIAEKVDEKSSYIKNKGFDSEYYQELVVKYLGQYESATRADLNRLLFSKLPDVLDDKQKADRVKNLLQEMRKSGIIDTDSSNRRLSKWILKK